MCDFSLEVFKSRRARKGDKLAVHRFLTHTVGMAQIGVKDCPTCLQPGTELAFDEPIRISHRGQLGGDFLVRLSYDTATFVQLDCDHWSPKGLPLRHRDAIETPDGSQYLLQSLKEGQTLTVLQVPAEQTVEDMAQEIGLEPKRDAYVVLTRKVALQSLADQRPLHHAVDSR